MTVQIALLRGVNVGGNNKIKMAELQSACRRLGFEDARTYIQSGNVLFSSELPEAELKALLEATLRDEFGVKNATVILRTHGELRKLLAECPFTAEEIATAHQLYVNLLERPLSPEEEKLLAAAETDGERCVVREREIYLLLVPSILDSAVAKQIGKLKLPVTARNWSTMNKLSELSAQMEA